MKKTGPMLLDPANVKTPYNSQKREKRTYIIFAARIEQRRSAIECPSSLLEPHPNPPEAHEKQNPVQRRCIVR